MVLGDALCSTNPVYAQGMSVAAASVQVLAGVLAGTRTDVARRFQRAVLPLVKGAWDVTTGGDLALPVVEGPRPAPLRAVNAYLVKLLAAAETDTECAAAFLRLANLVAPGPSVLAPRIVRRVRRRPRPVRVLQPVG